FFSKDQILYETFASGHTILWVVGLVTSLLTAIYMFRLVFLAFHGEPNRSAPAEHPEEEEPGAHRAQPHAAPAHGARPASPRHLHDAPPAMAVALVVLAVGSVFAGYAGLGNRFERFLAPSFK